MIKSSQHTGRIKGNFHTLIKNIYKKPTANIIHTGKKCSFAIRSGTRQRCSLSPLLFIIILEVVANTIRQQKEIKGKQTGKEEIQLSLFTNEIIIYVENLKEILKNPPRSNK